MSVSTTPFATTFPSSSSFRAQVAPTTILGVVATVSCDNCSAYLYLSETTSAGMPTHHKYPPIGISMGRRRSSTHFLVFFLTLDVQSHVLAQLQAPAWPIAVKNPYVNSWYQGGLNSGSLNSVDLMMWNGTPTAWFTGVQVDGVPYRIMGNDPTPPSNNSTQLSVQITPTQTIIEVQTGPVNVTMNFLTPITVRLDQYSRRTSFKFANSIPCRLTI